MFFNNKSNEVQPMFDQQRIGANIMKARKAKGYTQMTLADALGVSFQAVSNWERGQTCPDIANLSELSRVLDISIDELLGNRRAAQITRDIAKDRIPSLAPEELQQVAPLLTEEQADKAAGKKISMTDLMTIAPFVSEEFLSRQARKHLESGCTLWELSALAPFLDETVLGELLLNARSEGYGLSELSSIAPFVDEEILGTLVQRMMKEGAQFNSSELSAILPFLSDEMTETLLEQWL